MHPTTIKDGVTYTYHRRRSISWLADHTYISSLINYFIHRHLIWGGLFTNLSSTAS